MRWRSGAVFWAVILIALGVIFLLRNFGILRAGWDVIFPLLLIGLGGWLLLGSLVRREAPAAVSNSVPLEGARQARIEVNHGAGELRIGPSDDPAVLVSSTSDGGVISDVRRVGDRLDVRLREDRDWRFWMWPGHWGAPYRWSMAIHRDVPVALDVRTGASKAGIDLRDVKVTALSVEVGASSVDLTLPASGQVSARIKAGAADVKVRVPDGMALRVRSNVGAATLNVRGQRFQWGSNTYQSPDYGANPNRTDLGIEGGAATITVM